jgi:hypothetical protein
MLKFTNLDMEYYRELAAFKEPLPDHEQQPVNQKIIDSTKLITELADPEVIANITPESFLDGEVPRLSPFDTQLLPEGTRLVELPEETVQGLAAENAQDRLGWNDPISFLRRLEVGSRDFQAPISGNSRVMDRIIADGRVVSFANLRIESPVPENDRHSRTQIHETLGEHNIMGMARMPFALGSVPDVGSVLGYITTAQSNGMAFVARDKVLSDCDNQVEVVSRVINTLEEMELPDSIMPNEDNLEDFLKIMDLPEEDFTPETAKQLYVEVLRASWTANVGAAVEASSKGLERAKKLYDIGCRLIRIYSPEGGTEIVSQVAALREQFKDDPTVKIVAGQMMDTETAINAERAGADAIIIGVAGGSQCTTSKNAGIPVNTPNLLYKLRGKLNIPIGVEGGGVGDHLMTAFALGASFLLKPGEIGMSIEGAGARYMLQDPKGKYWMLYGGEASDGSKWWRDLLDAQGRPQFVEGEPGVRILPHEKYSMTRNIHKLKQQAAIGLVFQRAQSIEALQQRDCSNIVEVTAEAAQLSDAYGQ